jgi:hypothetical protein
MYVRKRVICEWCRWNYIYKKLGSWTNFTASRSWRKYFFTIVCRVGVCNVYAEKWVQIYRLFRWTRFLLIWLVKTVTECLSLVPRRKGMDFYRASNSLSWGAAVEGAVCRGCGASNYSSWGAAVEGTVCRGCGASNSSSWGAAVEGAVCRGWLLLEVNPGSGDRGSCARCYTLSSCTAMRYGVHVEPIRCHMGCSPPSSVILFDP